MAEAKKTNYGNESISSLKGADRVRKRPGVIFGSDGLDGCEHAVFEILSNSIDEAREGHGKLITITRYLDHSIEVEDMGRGCPVDYNPKEKRFNWELVYCELYAGGKYNNLDGDNYEYSLGLNGLGACATQYSSRYMDVTVWRDGNKYSLHFERGEPVGKKGDELRIEPTDRGRKTGTRTRWLPDLDVFTDIDIPADYYVETLRRQGALILATTHYAELKVFALETPGVVNASCEFNVETMRPTYKLSVGVPGKSNAFLISERLGVPTEVIDMARTHLSNDDKRLDSVLSQLDDLKLQLKASQAEAEQAKAQAANALESARKKREELIQQGETELEAARQKARKMVQEIQEEAYALTDELRKLQKDEKTAASQRAIRAREIARRDTEKLLAGEAGRVQRTQFTPLTEVRIGQEVEIADMGQRAVVMALPDRKGLVEVRAGILKTKVPLSNLKAPDKQQAPKQKPRQARQPHQMGTGGGHVQRTEGSRSAGMELDLRGKMVDEALMEVDQFIDHAIMNGLGSVVIIHGKGTGALRTGIQQHLRTHRHVNSFRLGAYGEGDAGVTVVELK